MLERDTEARFGAPSAGGGFANQLSASQCGGLSGLSTREGGRRAVGALAVARLIYAVNWLNLGALFALMGPALGAGVSGLGEATAAFYLGLGVAQVPSGLASARYGPKRPVFWGIVSASSASAAVSVCGQLWQVAALRFVVGVGMAFVFSPMVVLVARYFGGARAGVGVGLFNAAFDVGGLLGLYVWIVVATVTSWQFATVLGGMLGLATAAAVHLTVSPDSGSPHAVSASALRAILGDRQLILLGVGTLGLSVGNTLVASFMVYYLSQGLGVPLLLAGLATSMVMVMPIGTSLWAGRVFDRSGRPRALMLGSCAGMAIAVALASMQSPLASAAGAVVAGLSAGAGFTVAFAWARVLNRSGPEYEGLAVAWVDGISLTGAFVPPLVFSYVAGGYGYPAAWIAGAILCAALTVPLLFQHEGIPSRGGSRLSRPPS